MASQGLGDMQLEVSIRPNVSNTSSGCPFFSLHVFPCYLPSTFLHFFPDVCCFTSFLSTNSLSLTHFAPSGHLLSKDNTPLSTLRSFTVSLAVKVKEYSTFGSCLTECALAFSTLLFSCRRSSPCIPLLSAIATK